MFLWFENKKTLFREGASYLSENIICILILQWNVFNSNI